MIAICLNTKYEPTHIETISIGTLSSTVYTPREIFKTAIMTNSAAIIIAHNHPSGVVEPSKEDLEMTKRIEKAGSIIGIELIDCLIIAEKKHLSLKESDLF